MNPLAGLNETPLEQLARRFPAADIKTRTQGGKALHYIDIPQTIHRFNETLGHDGWSIVKASSSVVPSENGQYLATCEVFVDVGAALKYGVGAMVNKDPDMAIKTALAEAIKKAGHQLGIGLHLWDDRERALVDQVQDAEDQPEGSSAKLAAYKLAVTTLAQIKGVKHVNADTIAEALGVSTTDLQDEAMLRTILHEAGLI